VRVLGHLPHFLADPKEVFNPSRTGLVLLLSSSLNPAPASWASRIGRIARRCTLAWIVRQKRSRPQELLPRIWAVAVTLLPLTLQPWFLLWLMPFLAVQPRPAWIYLRGAVLPNDAFSLATPLTRALISVLEHLPFFLLLAWPWSWPGRRRSPLIRAGFMEIP